MSTALEFQRAVMGKEFGSVKDYSCNGKCSHCGACCSDIIPLLPSEIDTLRHFIRKNNYKPHTHACTVLMTNPYDATCPFLDDKGECVVYSIRPEICRLFSCYEKNPSTEDFAKLPRQVQLKFIRFYNKSPKVLSLRKEVFGLEVPF